MEDLKNGKWELDPTHSELSFRVKHMMISNVKGQFNTFTADINGADFTNATITATIDADSIDTNNEDRDKHLRSEDFFDVAKYPKLTFQSNAIEQKSDDEYTLKGTLTIKDTSKEITLAVTYGGTNVDPWGNEKAGFSFETKINRKDYGLTWNAALETGGVLVSDEVRIAGELQFVRK